MVHYRRSRIAGGTYFLTVTLRNRRSILLADHIDAPRSVFCSTHRARPFTIDAIVVLPQHFHMIMTLPVDDADYSGRISAIKSQFTRELVRRDVALLHNEKGEYDLWQRRFWEHTIRDDEDFQRHVDYIHYSPVKHGQVEHVCDWPYSSFHRFVRMGLLSRDWAAASASVAKESFGE